MRLISFFRYKEDFFWWMFNVKVFTAFQTSNSVFLFLLQAWKWGLVCLKCQVGQERTPSLWIICCHHDACRRCLENCISHCHVKLCDAHYLTDMSFPWLSHASLFTFSVPCLRLALASWMDILIVLITDL